MMDIRSTLLAATLLISSLEAKDFVNSIGMVFKEIPTGEFMMGSVTPKCPKDDPFTRVNEYLKCVNASDSNTNSDESPQHKVSIDGFYMGSTEVTQLQYYKVMGKNPSEFLTDELDYDSRHNPVDNVTWDDANAFVKRLNKMENTDKYRLPTEAEWEYAARAGTKTKWSFGDDELLIGDYAWYALNSGDQTHPVGKKQPNPWGLYDMHGNVWEWCQDWYVDNYDSTPTDGSANFSGPKEQKVLRGGSWIYFAQDARSAIRSYDDRSAHYVIVGFRVARDMGDETPHKRQPHLQPHLKEVKKKAIAKEQKEIETKQESIDNLFDNVGKK